MDVRYRSNSRCTSSASSRSPTFEASNAIRALCHRGSEGPGCTHCLLVNSAERLCDADDPYASPAWGCILTLKLTGEPEEHEKRSWTVPANFRNRNDAKIAVLQLAFEQGAIEFLRFRGEPPPEGYKVKLPAPRESKRRNGRGRMERRMRAKAQQEKVETPEPVGAISRIGQLPAKPAVSSRLSTGSFSQARTPANTGTTSSSAVLLPRPGYIDPKPEPGELPAEPPKEEPEHLPTSLLRCPATQPFE